MDIRGQRLYNYLGEEVNEFIIEPNAFIEAGETTFSDGLRPFGRHYRVAHCTARTACNGPLQEFVDYPAALDQDNHEGEYAKFGASAGLGG